jgi:hypothetical protein
MPGRGARTILWEFHDGAHLRFHSGGHFAAKATAHKIIRYGF